MIFAGIKLPPVRLPRSGNALLDRVIAEIEERLAGILVNLVRQVNDSLTKVFGRLNSALPILCIGQEIEVTIGPGEYGIGDDITIRHELGVKPTRFMLLDARVASKVVPGTTPWDGGIANMPWLLRSTTEWTDTHVVFKPSRGVEIYGGKFKILLMP